MAGILRNFQTALKNVLLKIKKTCNLFDNREQIITILFLSAVALMLMHVLLSLLLLL